jgi:hypothetical protein
MEIVSGGEIRTDEPAALDVSVRLCSPARENRWSNLLTLVSFSSVASPKDVSNLGQHRIAWFCHSKIMGNINRKAISEHPARAGRETIPATGERT